MNEINNLNNITNIKLTIFIVEGVDIKILLTDYEYKHFLF